MVGRRFSLIQQSSRRATRPMRIILGMLAILLAFGAAGDIARADSVTAGVWSVGGFDPLVLGCLLAIFAAMSGLVVVMYRRVLREQARFVRRVD